MPMHELSRLFDAERGAQPPPEALEQGLARFLGDVAAQVAPLPIATGALKLTWSVVSKWLIVGFAVGVAGAAATSRIWAPPTLAGAPATLTRSAQVESTEMVAIAPSAAPVPAPVNEPAKASQRSSSPASAPPGPSSTDGQATFDDELRLITAAKSELDRGRASQAKAWLAEHAQRFPAGVFAAEREGLQILAQCRQTREPQRARDFAQRHPSSPMTERLLHACTPSPTSAPSAVEFRND